jgi:hypothetical protein
VFTLALTPALSPEEWERTVTLPDNFSILMAVTDSVSLAVRRTTTRHSAWLKTRRMVLPLLSAFAFGFGAIASKRSEDGGERAGFLPRRHTARRGVRADVIPDVIGRTRRVLFHTMSLTENISKNQ